MGYKLLISVVCIVLAGCSFLGLKNEDEVITQEISTPIIVALDAYYTDRNTYPAQLVELAPIYLTELPKDTLGQEFSYRKDENDKRDNYFLCFFGSPSIRNDGCCYEPQNEIWDCTDGIDH